MARGGAKFRQMRPFHKIDTAHVPARERFNHWRAKHPGVDLAPVDSSEAANYCGKRLVANGPSSVSFGHSTSDGTVAQFGRKGSDTFLLSSTLIGSVEFRHGGTSTVHTARDPGFVLLDQRRESLAITRQTHAHVYLSLPRRVVFEAAGGDPLSGREVVRHLPHKNLFPLLWSHLQMLIEKVENLNAAEIDAAVNAAAGLALTALANAICPSPRAADCLADETLFVAAKRMIELRHGHSDLTGASLAASLGCSRAHLYRVFAKHGLMVAEHIRGVRLDAARQMLLRRTRRGIAQIAHEAGYEDATSFGRAFRKRFGMTPRDCRAGSTSSPETASRQF
jgi:AraC-like DNA-binding protein